VLDRDGQFWHDGERVEHPGVVRAFHRGLSRDPAGRYILSFGHDWCVIEVQDAPYQVLASSDTDRGLQVFLDDETSELAGSDALRSSEEGLLYAVVKGGKMLARFSRSAQAALASQLDLVDGRYVLRLRSGLWTIASPAPPPPKEATEWPRS
jgi:hypothetical protein